MNKSNTDSEMRIVECEQPDILSPEEHEALLEWSEIDWGKVERVVFKLQKRICSASRQGNIKKVRKLQKTLIRSYSNRLMAVRRVTQDNQGKKTAGIDGIKSLLPKARFKLVKNLRITRASKPLRRVWIPKPGKDEKRPLGIPTMYDRALQAVVKNALEPEWEAHFEPNSYGFRPGRNPHDAIKAIWGSIRQKPKYVLDADIAKCFDKINHDALLKKLNYKGSIRQQIKAWLKSGVIDNGVFEETTQGTPQGGVISPLLANIALDGLENLLEREFPAKSNGYLKGKKYGATDTITKPAFIRYADDFVILGETKFLVKDCKEVIEKWLKEMGLELKPEKTRLTHTLLPQESEDGKAGFDFLGFHIRQFPAGKYKSGKNSKGKALLFKTLVTPSEKSKKEHQKKLHDITLKKHSHSPQAALIKELNPVIRGWANYYKCSDSGSTGDMSKQDHLMWLKLRSWTKKRTGKITRAGRSKNKTAYFRTISANKWRFATEGGLKLTQHIETSCSVADYIKVEGNRTPYDGDWVYWSTRRGNHPEAPPKTAFLLKKQKGKCAYCGLYFKLEDIIEVDHIVPKSLGGKDDYKNLQLLHKHCHDVKTASDGSLKSHEKGRHIEEPDVVKVTSPVLEKRG